MKKKEIALLFVSPPFFLYCYISLTKNTEKESCSHRI
jgi:hypothetical protein